MTTPPDPPAAAAPMGLFVVFEGGDGAGKTTQIELLSAWLRERGVEHVLTREPGGTALGSRLREVLLHSDDAPVPRAEALLFAADRAQHVTTLVRPALAAGRWVVSDRYIDSSIAYQGGGRDLGPDEIAQLSAWATGDLVPDLTVLLDVPVEVGAARREAARGAHDRMESETVSFHEQVRARFLERAASAPQRYLVLDAAADPADLARDVRERLRGHLAAPTDSCEPAGSAADSSTDGPNDEAVAS